VFRVFGSDGTPKTSAQYLSTGNGLRNDCEVAATATHVAELWELNGVIEWARADSSLGASASEALSTTPVVTPAKGPMVGALPSGFGVAWHLATNSSSGDLEYKERGSDGSAGCAAAKLGSFNSAWPIGIASHASGSLVAVLDATSATNASAALVRSKDCNLIDQLPVATFGADSIDQLAGAFAAGDDGYAMVWTEGIAGSGEIHGRLFGPNLCD
jgi:hypothetical protein